MTAKTNTNHASDVTVRIIGPDGVEVRTLEHRHGEITIDLAADDGATIATDPGSGERREMVVEDAGREGDASVDEVPHQFRTLRAEGSGFYGWLPVVPTLSFLVAALAAILVGPAVWSPGASPLGELPVRLGHIWLFGISLAGTLWMWNDGVAREDRDAVWQPRMTAYIVAGAAGLGVFGGGFFLTQGVPLGDLVVAAAGVSILGLPMSSVVSGPVYAYNRSRQGDRQRSRG